MKETREENEERLQTHPFHTFSNFLQDSFSLFACKNAYVESSSLVISDAKAEPSKLVSPGGHAEDWIFMEKANSLDQHYHFMIKKRKGGKWKFGKGHNVGYVWTNIFINTRMKKD